MKLVQKDRSSQVRMGEQRKMRNKHEEKDTSHYEVILKKLQRSTLWKPDKCSKAVKSRAACASRKADG